MPRVLRVEHRALLAAQDGHEMRGPTLDEVDLVARWRWADVVDPALEPERTVVVEVDARATVRVVLRTGWEADRPLLEMELEPRSPRRWCAEAGQHLPERSALELQVDEHVIGRRHRDRLAGTRTTTDDARWITDRPHRLHPRHRPHERRQLMQAIDAMVDKRADPRLVEDGRIARVLAPRRWTGISVMGHRQGEPTEPPRLDDLAQPPDATADRASRRTEQEQLPHRG